MTSASFDRGLHICSHIRCLIGAFITFMGIKGVGNLVSCLSTRLEKSDTRRCRTADANSHKPNRAICRKALDASIKRGVDGLKGCTVHPSEATQSARAAEVAFNGPMADGSAHSAESTTSRESYTQSGLASIRIA
jgi:hypothetical protein